LHDKSLASMCTRSYNRLKCWKNFPCTTAISYRRNYVGYVINFPRLR